MKLSTAIKPVVVAALLSASSFAGASTPREQISEVLASYEAKFTKADLLALSPDAEAIVADLLADEHTWLFVRSRALSTLSMFPSEQNLTRTLAVLQQNNPLLRQYAAMLLGRVWAKTFPDRVLAPLNQALADQDMMVRRYAVRSLAAVGSAPALQALRQRLAVEPHAEVAHLIETQLNRRLP